MSGLRSLSRRQFLGDAARFTAAGALAAGSPKGVPAAPARRSPNETVRLGLIGVNNRGFHVLQNALAEPDVVCTALCDVDAVRLAERVQEVGREQDRPPVACADFRRLLDDPDVDAVIVGSPDHWHCLHTALACEAGKDVYVEKPLANSIAECDVIVRAARRYDRVVQVGQQQRSGAHWSDVMARIRDGEIGPLRKVQLWANFRYAVGPPVVPDAPVPEGVDYDGWLGPAPERPFNPARFHGSWRMFWDYGGGLMTDWGVHLIDMALWAGNVTALPRAVVSTGGCFAYPEYAHETADTQSASFEMEDLLITWEHTAGIQSGPYGRPYGVAFIGNDATIVADRGGWELFPESENGRYRVPALPPQDGRSGHAPHVTDFLACVRSREEPACPVETGRLAAVYAHLANIAYRTGTRLVWDPANGRFQDNPAADALITPSYRDPWTLPDA